MKYINLNRQLPQAVLATVITVFIVAGIAGATTIGTNISTDGTLTVIGNTTLASTTISYLTFGSATSSDYAIVGPNTAFTVDRNGAFKFEGNGLLGAYSDSIVQMVGELQIGPLLSPYTTINSNITTSGTLTVSGTTTIDSGVFFVDVTNDRVGIGTTSPQYKLDVNGDINFTGNLYQDGSLFSSGGSSGSVWSTSSSNIYYSNGNVGIGTTTPSEKLTLSEGNFLQISGSPEFVAGLGMTGTAYSVFVLGNYAYVAVGGGGGDELEIVDISNPLFPEKIGGVSLSDTARDVYVAGGYAYVVNNSAGNGLEIVDISNPSSPSVVGGVSTADTARAVFVSGRYAYVGSQSTGDDLEIFDISSSTAPRKIGGVDSAGSIYDLYVKGNYAYTVNFNLGGEELEIFDISDPANPSKVGGADSDTNTANGIYVTGNYAYVVSNSTGDDLEIFDISDPASPVKVGGVDATDNAYDVKVAGNYAYVASRNGGGNDNLEIFDISSSTNPTRVGGIATADNAYGIFVSGKYIYVASDTIGNELEIFKTASIDSPTANIGNIKTNHLNVVDDIFVGNNAYFGRSINIGEGGIMSNGPLSITNKNMPSYFGSNVGIGTTTPDANLQVYGGDSATSTLKIGGSSSNKGACLKFRDSDGAGWSYCTILDGTLSCSQTSCE